MTTCVARMFVPVPIEEHHQTYDHDLPPSRPTARTIPPTFTGTHVLGEPGQLDADDVCAWFGGRLVLESVDLTMEQSRVTALIGPSGCGKSTYLRILNRMHELVPGAQLAGRVELDGVDIYGGGLRATETRRQIGMVFQKPNPFPAMTIAENVLSGLKFSQIKLKSSKRDSLVEEMLIKAGLWAEVRIAWTSWVARSPAVSSSGSASPEPWLFGPGSSSWTSPARLSTPPRPTASRSPSARSPTR